MKEFERGMEYEQLSHDAFNHASFGFACVGMGLIWFFLSVHSFKERLWGAIGLLIFGLICLSLWFSEKRELKKFSLGEKW